MPLFMDEVPENVADAPEFEALQQLAYMEGSPDELLKQARVLPRHYLGGERY